MLIMGKQTLTEGLTTLEKQGETRPKPEEKETQAVQNFALVLPWQNFALVFALFSGKLLSPENIDSYLKRRTNGVWKGDPVSFLIGIRYATQSSLEMF